LDVAILITNYPCFPLPAEVVPVCYLFILTIMYLGFKLDLILAMQFCWEPRFMWEVD
jgi:hypothetical protein